MRHTLLILIIMTTALIIRGENQSSDSQQLDDITIEYDYHLTETQDKVDCTGTLYFSCKIIPSTSFLVFARSEPYQTDDSNIFLSVKSTYDVDPEDEYYTIENPILAGEPSSEYSHGFRMRTAT